MAERRMFSKRIVGSARFLKMPISTQCLEQADRDWSSGEDRVDFERDKFSGYDNAPFIDALTDDRHI